MDALAGALGAALGLLVLWVLFSAFFIWIGAKMAFIPKASFGRAVMTAIACGMGSFFLSGILLFLPGIGPLLGQIIGIVLSLFIIKAMFDTSFGKALLAWMFQIFAVVIALLVCFLTFGGVLFRALNEGTALPL